MNPYVFNPYAIAAANAQAAAAATNPYATATSMTPAVSNPYAAAAAMAANNPAAMAQAAALNAYSQNMQQQLNTLNAAAAVAHAAAVAASSSATSALHTNGLHIDASGGLVMNQELDEEDAHNHKNKLVVEHDGFYNMKPLLAENILSSDYFKSLYRFKTYHEVIDETTRFCKNVEPLMVGLSRKPSTAFCILYKLFCMELTVRQAEGLVNYMESPLVRCIGFLYLRYLLPAKELWKWFSPYLDDAQEFSPGADGKVITMHSFVANLLQQQKYFSTLLPRIPLKIERAYKKRLLQQQLIKQRDAEHESFRAQLREGLGVRAQWQDLKWYDAVIDECLESGRFSVTFTEYDDECEISIGQIQMVKRSRSRSRSRSRDMRRRSRSRSRSRSRDRRRRRRRRRDGNDGRNGRDRRDRRDRDRDGQRPRRHRRRKDDDKGRSGEVDMNVDDEKRLEEMVRQKEKEAVVAVGRDYARRPTAYYHSLTLHLETGTNRKRSPTPPANANHKKKKKKSVKESEVVASRAEVNKMPSKQHVEKMRLLKLRYGDASKAT